MEKQARETEAKAKREAELAAKEKARQEAEEAKAAAEAEAKAKKEAELAAGTELYQGIVKLTITPPIDFGAMKKLEESLHQVENLRLILLSGSIGEGTIIVISAEKPIPLINILRAMPSVEQAVKRNEKIMVILKPLVAG